VDIFDAGPTVEANLKHIRTAQASSKMPIEINDEKAAQGQDHLVINTKVANFCGLVTELTVDQANKLAFISQAAAAALEIENGHSIRFAPTTFKG